MLLRRFRVTIGEDAPTTHAAVTLHVRSSEKMLRKLQAFEQIVCRGAVGIPADSKAHR